MGTHGINTSMISGILSLQGVQDRSFFNNEEQPNDKPAATTCPCGKARRQTIKYKKGVTGQFPCELCKLYIQKNPSPTVFVCLECEGSSGKRGWAAPLDCKKARAEADKRASEQAARLDAGRRAEECTAKKVLTCKCGKARRQKLRYQTCGSTTGCKGKRTKDWSCSKCHASWLGKMAGPVSIAQCVRNRMLQLKTEGLLT